MTLDATTQAFLTAEAQSDASEIDDGLLAETRASDTSVAELGRWSATDHGFLRSELAVVAAAVGGTANPALTAAQQHLLATLTPLSSDAFNKAYLTANIAAHMTNLDADQVYVQSHPDATVTQLAAAALPITQDQLVLLSSIDTAIETNGTTYTGFSQTFPAAPRLAAIGSNDAADQAFINAAVNTALTGSQEGDLALPLASGIPADESYAAWEIVDDGSLSADLDDIATASGATIPGAVDSASAAQIAALGSLTERPFDTRFAEYSITNDEAAVTAINSEASGGADPALVALAKAMLPTAQQLLAQAVIDYGETAIALNDFSAAPSTLLGSILNAAADRAADGAVISDLGSTTTPSTLAAGQAGIQFVNASTVAAAGYGFILDTADARGVTITGAAGQFEAVDGGAGLSTYDGAPGGSGEIALNFDSLMLGAPTSGAYYVDSEGGFDTVAAGNGNDSIVTGTNGSDLIFLGSGHNVVITNGSVSLYNPDTVVGSAGADTVFANLGAYANAASAVVFAGSQGITYVGGAGTSGTIYTGPAAATVFGGSGGTVSLSGPATGSVIVAGAGNETLNGAGLTGAATFFAGGGNDIITGGAPSLFVLGTGNATVSGAGGDMFKFVNGLVGGSDRIAFSPSDLITLSNYGSGAAAAVLASQATVNGAVTFTLPDNTHVTLTGVSSLTASNVV